MRVFVTGATGIQGRATIRELLEANHEPIGVARGEAKAELVRDLGAEPREVDVFDRDALASAMRGCEAVMHLATSIPPARKMWRRSAWRMNDRLRTEGARAVAGAAQDAGARILIQPTVSFVYAEGADRWLDESAAIDAPSGLASALEAERIAGDFTGGARIGIVLRNGAFYGPETEPSQMAARGWSPVIGKQEAYTSSLHTDDAAAAAVAALEAPAGTYNVVDDEPVPRGELLDILRDAFGHDRHPRRAPPWLVALFGADARALMRSQRVSNARFKRATGWKPRHPDPRSGWKRVARALASETR